MLFATSKWTFLVAIFLAALAGVANVSLIPLVLYFVNQRNNLTQSIQEQLPWLTFEPSIGVILFSFFIYFVLIICIRSAAQIFLAKLAINASKQLRISLYRRISRANVADVEQVGPSSLISAINVDVSKIVTGAEELPNLIVTLTTILGLLLYLAYIDYRVCIAVTALILFGVVTSRLPFYYARQLLQRSRNIVDQVQEGLRGLIYGHKELTLRANERQQYLTEELETPEHEMAKRNQRAQNIMILAMNYGGMISFFVIGVFVFFSESYFSLSEQATLSVVMVMLYISAPLGKLVGLFRPLAAANVAIGKLTRLLALMPIRNELGSEPALSNGASIKSIRLKNVEKAYQDAFVEDESFKLGPVSLDINEGEVLFIVGGNGSGKTSLAKIISLHYQQDSGQVIFNDDEIDNKNIEHYRQHISSIYSDFYLFSKLYLSDSSDVEADIDQYLNDLGLNGVVSYQDDRFSTLKLSSGQRRRLALLVTYLENRKVVLFDEWSADQDPEYRETFYKVILPTLKAKAKIVIVITHDDRYFDCADKLIVMDKGVIRESYTQHQQQNIEIDNSLAVKGSL